MDSAGRWLLSLAEGAYDLPLKQADGLLVFSESFDEDCDALGCGNVRRIHGIVYYRKSGSRWLPTIKVNTEVEFLFPDDPEAPEGLVKSTAYLENRTNQSRGR